MRKAFVEIILDLFKQDKKLITFLGDIGIFGFRDAFKNFPNRIYNIGILEQSMISVAAGLSIKGFHPVIHTIAPFMIERAYEQLKNDFGYQSLNGNFVSVGASYDYASLGPTHHCPSDISILGNIPNFEIVVPGHQDEFKKLFKVSYKNGNPTYFRLSEDINTHSFDVQFGKINYIKKSNSNTYLIFFGPSLKISLSKLQSFDCNIVYVTTLKPFDKSFINLINKKRSKNLLKIIFVEPFYSYSFVSDFLLYFNNSKNLELHSLGIKKEFISYYGSRKQIDKIYKLDTNSLYKRLKKII